ncbi:MAG: hypothetical protein DI551_00600 [Micavibrio aeruginosavorus]|uniref:Uncharacterized protein n=1 Tax=Micavibrio aeruginosavorus TaxID=349221 RepID=A0A2W5Q280_9BACT|nr:MAG: hypothetical protein DI551_00600 [Micavibrio aeruginosavorus]
MPNVLKFPTNFRGVNGSWLSGYAAGLADASRDGHDIGELVKQSGLTLEQFIQAGTDVYDIEEMEKVFWRSRP